MVGDRLGTDIQMAQLTGAASALVLTGEATADDVAAMAEPDRPDFVLDRVDRLLPPMYWKEFGWEEGSP
jgi:ribonucleotide monophosphatase NagD (HAD superfamily)